MKNIEIKRKIFGEKNVQSITANIPDKLHKLLIDYKIELIDYGPIYPEMGLFIIKNENDFLSVTFNPKLNNAFKNVFEYVYTKFSDQLSNILPDQQTI